MKLKKILRSLCGDGLLALMLMAAVTVPARAQSDAAKSYPNRVIRMIVGFGTMMSSVRSVVTDASAPNNCTCTRTSLDRPTSSCLCRTEGETKH